MKSWRSLLPGQTPDRLLNQDSLSILQEKALQFFLLLMTAVCVPIAVRFINFALLRDSRQIAISWSLIILILVFLTIIRDIPYKIRAYSLIVLMFSTAVATTLTLGSEGEPGTFLFTSLVLAVLFIDLRTAIITTLLGGVLITVAGYGELYGTIDFSRLSQPEMSYTFYTAGVFTALGILTSILINILLKSFRESLVKQSNLTAELSLERASLENRVQQRTGEMERRLVQLRTAAEISRSVASVLDPQHLLQRVADLVLERNNYYYVGVFLVDEHREYAVLMAGTGEAGRTMLAEGHRLQIGGSSMIGWATSNRQARIASDVGMEAIRFDNPHLPLTRSELALPIISRNVAIGALSIQSSQPNAFDESDIVILQGVADSLAIAIDNARLFQQSQADLEEIRALNRRFLYEAWSDVTASHSDLNFTFENPIIHENTGGTYSFKFPIILREQTIGNIIIESINPSISKEDGELVESILSQTALALESARLLEETQRRVSQEEKVNTLSAEFARATNIEQILQSAIRGLGQLPTVSEVSVRLAPAIQVQSLQGTPDGKNGRD